MGVIFKHLELELQGLETPTYKLSAIVGADSFFYAIEERSNALVHLETYFPDMPLALFEDPLDFLSDLMAGNPLLFEAFDQKCFGVVGVPYLVVTDGQLERNTPVRLLGAMTHLAAKDAVQVQQIPSLGAVCIFAIPASLGHELEMYFDSPVYQHVMGSLLEWFARHDAVHPSEEKRIHLHCIGPFAFIIGLEREKVVFHNQFRCAEIPDLIYFTSAVLEDLEWKAWETKLSVSGHRRTEILDHPDFHQLFAASLIDLPLENAWPQEAHNFLDLFAVSQCAL